MSARGEFEAAACTGKVRFTSYAAAARVQKRRAQSHDRGLKQGEVYRCPVCHWFHLGRKSDQERPKRDWQRFRARYEREDA